MADKTAPPAQPSEAEIRELVMRGEQLRQQLGALEAQQEYVGELALEARRALTSVEALEKANEGDEVLLPLGAGAFIHAKLASPRVALTSLGSGVHAELPTGDAVTRLRARVESLDGAQQAVARDLARVSDEIARINALAESIYGG